MTVFKTNLTFGRVGIMVFITFISTISTSRSHSIGRYRVGEASEGDIRVGTFGSYRFNRIRQATNAAVKLSSYRRIVGRVGLGARVTEQRGTSVKERG